MNHDAVDPYCCVNSPPPSGIYHGGGELINWRALYAELREGR